MAYEVFDNKFVKFGSPRLTISRGRILFNADAGDILAGVGAKFVHILWDRERCRLAIRPVAKEDGRSFRLTFAKGKRSGAVTAMSFLNSIQWRGLSATVVDASWNKSEGLLEAQ